MNVNARVVESVAGNASDYMVGGREAAAEPVRWMQTHWPQWLGAATTWARGTAPLPRRRPIAPQVGTKGTGALSRVDRSSGSKGWDGPLGAPEVMRHHKLLQLRDLMCGDDGAGAPRRNVPRTLGWVVLLRRDRRTQSRKPPGKPASRGAHQSLDLRKLSEALSHWLGRRFPHSTSRSIAPFGGGVDLVFAKKKETRGEGRKQDREKVSASCVLVLLDASLLGGKELGAPLGAVDEAHKGVLDLFNGGVVGEVARHGSARKVWNGEWDPSVFIYRVRGNVNPGESRGSQKNTFFQTQAVKTHLGGAFS